MGFSCLIHDPTSSGGEQIGEAVLIAAQLEPQEKKLIYHANVLANLAFTTSVDRAQAYMLIRLAGKLSYRQVCMIAIFAKTRLQAQGQLLRQLSAHDGKTGKRIERTL
jgi:hypothetical protein